MVAIIVMIITNKINKNNQKMNLMMNKDLNYIVNNRYCKIYYQNSRNLINKIYLNIQIYS